MAADCCAFWNSLVMPDGRRASRHRRAGRVLTWPRRRPGASGDTRRHRRVRRDRPHSAHSVWEFADLDARGRGVLVGDDATAAMVLDLADGDRPVVDHEAGGRPGHAAAILATRAGWRAMGNGKNFAGAAATHRKYPWDDAPPGDEGTGR